MERADMQRTFEDIVVYDGTIFDYEVDEAEHGRGWIDEEIAKLHGLNQCKKNYGAFAADEEMANLLAHFKRIEQAQAIVPCAVALPPPVKYPRKARQAKQDALEKIQNSTLVNS